MRDRCLKNFRSGIDCLDMRFTLTFSRAIAELCTIIRPTYNALGRGGGGLGCVLGDSMVRPGREGGRVGRRTQNLKKGSGEEELQRTRHLVGFQAAFCCACKRSAT